MIEVELRTFLTENKYYELLNYFKNNGCSINTQKQVTYYFSGKQDFRLMLTKNFCQLWLKKGELHDEAREELVVKIDNQYRQSLISMLKALEFDIKIKWFRIRNSFVWNNFDVTLDYTHGYGYILEFEMLVENEENVEEGKQILKKQFDELDIEIVDKQLFKDKYEDYKENWQTYTKDISEEDFI